jgi:hypothetical protein
MADTSMSDSIFPAERQTAQMKVERRQLVWRFLLSFGAITATVTVATLFARMGFNL